MYNRMNCDHEHPELCKILADGVPGGHVSGRFLELWNTRRPYRAMWCHRARVSVEELEARFPPTQVQAAVRPRRDRRQQPPVPEKTSAGLPGTKLKTMMEQMGVREAPGCSCKKMARKMDDRGPDWCEENIEEIVDSLETEARRRPVIGILFVRAVARTFVKRAIKQARKEARKEVEK